MFNPDKRVLMNVNATAAEWIEELQKLPPETPVSICGAVNGYIHVETDEHDHPTGVTIDCEPLDDCYPDPEPDPEDYRSWESISKRLKGIEPGIFMFGVMCGAGTNFEVRDRVNTIREITGAGTMECHLADALCSGDVVLAVQMLTEHRDDFRAKANEIYGAEGGPRL